MYLVFLMNGVVNILLSRGYFCLCLSSPRRETCSGVTRNRKHLPAFPIALLGCLTRTHSSPDYESFEFFIPPLGMGKLVIDKPRKELIEFRLSKGPHLFGYLLPCGCHNTTMRPHEIRRIKPARKRKTAGLDSDWGILLVPPTLCRLLPHAAALGNHGGSMCVHLEKTAESACRSLTHRSDAAYRSAFSLLHTPYLG